MPRMHKNAVKWMSEFKEYGYILEYNALLVSVDTCILEASHFLLKHFTKNGLECSEARIY